MKKLMVFSRRCVQDFTSFIVLLWLAGCQLQATPSPETTAAVPAETDVIESPHPTQTMGFTEAPASPTLMPSETPGEPTDAPITLPPPEPTPAETEPTPTTSPTSTPSPEPRLTPTREILFQDNFQATQGWYTYESDRYRMEYSSGKYHIYNNILSAAITSYRTQNYADIYLEVEAARVSGPPNGYFGLICRLQDDNNYYALVIGSDGSYGIVRMTGGSVQFISPPPRPLEVIRGGFMLNRIGASCVGDKLTLFVNGEKVVEVSDSSYSSGFIGLVVGTTSVPGLEVSFDNFFAKKP
jgi:hypothetical protein